MPEPDLVVQRVQADDAKRVADFVNGWVARRAPHRPLNVRPRTVIARLGEVGFLIAEEGDEVLGVIGWHVENLVACVTDLLVRSPCERVGQALLSEMEAQATGLQAEVALLRHQGRETQHEGHEEVVSFCEAFGYALRTVGELPRAWREMAHQAGYEDEDEILLKQLRSGRVVRPL